MTNLAGHDLPFLLEAFGRVDHDRPICFICYTIKGYGLPFAGHKDNHAGLMTPAQMEALRQAMNIRPGHEWDPFEGLSIAGGEAAAIPCRVPFAMGDRAQKAPPIPPPRSCGRAAAVVSTQAGFGALLNELGRGKSEFADRIVTTSPDVTVSTNLGPWVNRRGLFARQNMVDIFKSERIPSTFNWDFSPKGQHIELGIAEMNLFILLSALGLRTRSTASGSFPIGTLYDPFIPARARCAQLRLLPGRALFPGGDACRLHACARRRRASVDRHPAHRASRQDGLAAFEPAFVDELSVILAFAFDYIQRDGEGEAPNATGCATRPAARSTCGSPRDRSSRSNAHMTPELRQAIVDGAYWLRGPGPNCQVVVAYTGAVAPEAIQAVGLHGRRSPRRRSLAVTSADRLNAGWTAAQRARERGLVHARSHIERLLAEGPSHCGIVTVLDGHPATLAWLGAVARALPAPARGRAFRPDRIDPGALPPLRHRRQCHRRGSRRAHPGHGRSGTCGRWDKCPPRGPSSNNFTT